VALRGNPLGKEADRVSSEPKRQHGRLCYVLQRYQEDATDCSPHLYRFLEELAKRVDLFVVIERAQGNPRLRGARRIYSQRWRSRALRLLEMVAILLWARCLGYRRVFVRYSHLAMFPAALLRLLGVRVYYWNCGMMKEFFRPWSLAWRDWLFKLTTEFPLRFSLKAASHVVTGTEAMARYYARHFGLAPSRVLVVPNDVDVAGFLQGLGTPALEAERRPVVLYVGRLDRANGADRLPMIAGSVCRLVPAARFVIVGDGSLRQTIEREVQARGIGSRISFIGPVPNTDVARFYAQADVFILPAIAEGMPRVLLESMAAGLPFVATAVGGVNDLVTAAQRQWLTDPNDLEGFADRVVELLTHPEIREQLRNEGRRRVQDFTRERICALFVERILNSGEYAEALRSA
jgi:glycosyltransferase involved in cell wall biosynthesis